MIMMGSYLGIQHEGIDNGMYALLARDLSSYYMPSLWLEPDLQTAMAQFKHGVYCFALRASGFDQLKCVYLYEGNERLAKCHFLDDERLTVSFIDEDIARLFDSMDERLPPASGERSTAWLERKFMYHFGAIGGDAVDRRWINLGRPGYNS